MSIFTNYCQVHEAEMSGRKIPPGQLCATCGEEHCGVWAECLRNYWAIVEAIELGHPKPEGVKEETWLMHCNEAKERGSQNEQSCGGSFNKEIDDDIPF